METIEQLNKEIERLEEEISNLKDEKKDLEDDLEGARNDKKALYDLLMELCDDVALDVDDRVSEARQSAKEYVK